MGCQLGCAQPPRSGFSRTTSCTISTERAELFGFLVLCTTARIKKCSCPARRPEGFAQSVWTSWLVLTITLSMLSKGSESDYYSSGCCAVSSFALLRLAARIVVDSLEVVGCCGCCAAAGVGNGWTRTSVVYYVDDGVFSSRYPAQCWKTPPGVERQWSGKGSVSERRSIWIA